MRKIANLQGLPISLILLEERLACEKNLQLWKCTCGAQFLTIYYALYHVDKKHPGDIFEKRIRLKKNFEMNTFKWKTFYEDLSNNIFETIGSRSPEPKVEMVKKMVKVEPPQPMSECSKSILLGKTEDVLNIKREPAEETANIEEHSVVQNYNELNSKKCNNEDNTARAVEIDITPSLDQEFHEDHSFHQNYSISDEDYDITDMQVSEDESTTDSHERPESRDDPVTLDRSEEPLDATNHSPINNRNNSTIALAAEIRPSSANAGVSNSDMCPCEPVVEDGTMNIGSGSFSWSAIRLRTDTEKDSVLYKNLSLSPPTLTTPPVPPPMKIRLQTLKPWPIHRAQKRMVPGTTGMIPNPSCYPYPDFSCKYPVDDLFDLAGKPTDKQIHLWTEFYIFVKKHGKAAVAVRNEWMRKYAKTEANKTDSQDFRQISKNYADE